MEMENELQPQSTTDVMTSETNGKDDETVDSESVASEGEKDDTSSSSTSPAEEGSNDKKHDAPAKPSSDERKLMPALQGRYP